ncbi:MAG: hypothetical protein COA78_38520 [Blastopirellula sp.]|nr:MAG: hypothetical protein COA78_38520 [Blastopirellula sp.]
MKREFRWLMLIAILGSIGAGAYMASPSLRAQVSRQSQSVLGWTVAARQTDPAGFTQYVEQRLRDDLSELKLTRAELATEVGTLSKKEKEQRDLLEHAEQFAAEYRTAYQTETYPVSIRNAEYSSEEVVSQVSLLLAEADGYRQSLVKLTKIRKLAEQRLEELAVRINSTQMQLAATATQRGLLRSRVLTDDGERLVAQVDALLDTNSVAMHGNPVRSVRELLVSTSEINTDRPSLEVAREFLMTRPKPEIAVESETDQPVKPRFADFDFIDSESTALRPNQGETPIFQQN